MILCLLIIEGLFNIKLFSKGNCGQSEYTYTLIRLFRPIGSHQHSVSQIHNALLHCTE